jgi:hypothetical protein
MQEAADLIRAVSADPTKTPELARTLVQVFAQVSVGQDPTDALAYLDFVASAPVWPVPVLVKDIVQSVETL